MDWVYLVLKKIGLGQKIIDRLKRIYKVGLTVVVVNNILGRCFPNIYHLLRQGDKPSMIFFGIGIDPLLRYLERRLYGIDIWSIPRHGPTIQSCISSTLPPMKQKYRLISYADDAQYILYIWILHCVWGVIGVELRPPFLKIEKLIGPC